MHDHDKIVLSSFCNVDIFRECFVKLLKKTDTETGDFGGGDCSPGIIRLV